LLKGVLFSWKHGFKNSFSGYKLGSFDWVWHLFVCRVFCINVLN
jgi:hypothetical protein